jgi:hypothetical protein
MALRMILAAYSLFALGAQLAAAAGDPVEHLLDLAATHKDESIRQGAVNGLVALGWQPKTDTHWEKVVAIGPNAIPLIDALLEKPEPAIRVRALNTLVVIAKAAQPARAGAIDRLARTGTTDRAPEVLATAAKGMVNLHWPASDDELNKVVQKTPPPWPLIDQLLLPPAGDHTPRVINAVKELAAKPETSDEAKALLTKFSIPRDTQPPPSKEPPKPEPSKEQPKPEPSKEQPSEQTTVQVMLGPNWRPRKPDDWAQLAALGPRALPVADRLLADKDPEMRANAAQLLGTIGERDAAARPDMLERLTRLAGAKDGEAAARTAAEAVVSLVRLAKADRQLRGKITSSLLAVVTAKPDPAVREATLTGLISLEWCPVGEEERKAVAALGASALPLADALLGDKNAHVRQMAVRMVGDIAEADKAARDEAVRGLVRIAQADADSTTAELATKRLRGLGWPQDDKEWRELVAFGAPATRLIDLMVAEKDEETRGRAVAALAQVATAHDAARPYAIGRLAVLAKVERSRLVRDAIMAGLSRLRWPESDEEWKALGEMGPGALCLLARLERKGSPEVRAKAIARAKELCTLLLASAERAVDNVALLDGLELQWDIALRDGQAEIAALVEKGDLDQAATLFSKAMSDCEETEKKVHTLIVEGQAWPLGGVAAKWRALQQALEGKALAKLREKSPLTTSNWLDNLKQRATDAEAWEKLQEQVTEAATPAARQALLADYLKNAPQSFYAPFAWKWKDIVPRTIPAPKP